MPTTSQLESIFFSALEKHSPAERAAYLENACGGNADLRDRLERMIAAQSDGASFLEQPVIVLDAAANYEASIAEGPGTDVGHYKLLEEIGEGDSAWCFWPNSSSRSAAAWR